MPAAEPLPIASSGDLSLMPPSTGLPTPHAGEVESSRNAALTPILDHIPHAEPTESAATNNGFHPVVSEHNTIHTPAEPAPESPAEAPIHG